MENGLQLANICESTRHAILEGIDWLSHNQEALCQDTANLQKHLKLKAFKAKKLKLAAQRKPGIGVFGASQAGKSYLVSTLARKGTTPLMALFGDTAIDFIESINPEGGRESTGVVTRFTVDEPEKSQAEYPVCLELLSVTDIIKILANSYIFDLRHENDTDENHDLTAIHSLLQDLESSASSEPISSLSEEDILDLEQYCLHKLGNKNSNRRMAALKSVDYWNRTSRLAPYLSNVNLTRLFGLLWENLQVFSKIFSQLMEALTQLNHPKTLYCALEGLCNIENSQYTRLLDGSIVDVETLLKRELGGQGGQKDDVPVCTKAGIRTRLSRSILTALIAELVITMEEKPTAFFDNTDLLDFPGARSRETRAKDPGYIDTAKTRPRLFLRGKVAYLFERYCENKDLTSLLLCSGFENMEVISLPEMVFDWISVTHGSTPEKRAQLETSLFLVMTKFDHTAFKQAAGDGDISNRWAARLETSFIKPYSLIPNDWPNHWQGEGKVFNNCFCVRNPNYKQDHIFEYETGANQMQETGIRLEKQEFVSSLKQSFLDSPLLRTHINDVEKSWEALMELNDGGISHLLSGIEAACKPYIKEKQILTLITEMRSDVKKELEEFYITGDLNEEIEKKRELGKKLRLALMNTDNRFPELIQLLQLDEDILYNIYISLDRTSSATPNPTDVIGTEIDQTSGGAAPEGDQNSTDDIFWEMVQEHDPLNETNKVELNNVPSIEVNKSNDDFACRYMKAIREHWDAELINLSNNQEILDYFEIEKQHLLDISHEISLGMQREEIFDQIIHQVRETSNRREADNEAQIWKTITPVFYLFNEYIDWLGFGGLFSPKGTMISLGDILGKDKDHTVFTPPESPGEYPELMKSIPNYGKKYLLDWLIGLSKLIIENVPFYLNIKINIDPAMNSRLGDILKKLNCNR